MQTFAANHDLEIAATIPFDETFSLAERAGMAPLDFNPDSPAIAPIGRLAEAWGANAMDELEVLRVRDEVLQAMYWMHSEAISTTPTAQELSRFLAVPEGVLDRVPRSLRRGRAARARDAGCLLAEPDGHGDRQAHVRRRDGRPHPPDARRV